MILGTAGHIDHGKTALVRALTGVDTDRLPEEQRRGITIELGFAPLVLEGVGTIGVVDVPGHEAFVRTMVAGATGIDVALLVIAADEGPMPQTREHLAILELLGIRAGVIALTKTDLVDAEWLALVQEDVRALAASTPLAAAPIVSVSIVTGAGLPDLRRALASVVAAVPHRAEDDLFRLPVDRAFTVRGTGTVVTGTVWSGTVRRDAVVRVMPSGREARVRGLQSHGVGIDVARPAERTAVSLGGIEPASVPRGATLVTDDAWGVSTVVRADVTLLADAPALGPRTSVRVHHGTREVAGRVVAIGGSVRPGDVRPVRLVLSEPLTARAGDRFVLRVGSPVATIGGGVISDPLPPHRRARPWPRTGLSAPERLTLVVAESGGRGVARATVPVRVGVRPEAVERLMAAVSDHVEVVEDTCFDRGVVAAARAKVVTLVDAYHRDHPLEEGASLQSVRSASGVAPLLADAVVQGLVADGTLGLDHGVVRRRGWAPSPSPAQEALLETLERMVHAAGREPPSVAELVTAYATGNGAGRLGADDVTGLLRLLERRGRIVQVDAERYYSADALAAHTEALRSGMKLGREYSPSELREVLQVSRKYLIPLLEFFDRRGVTERRAMGRVLRAG